MKPCLSILLHLFLDPNAVGLVAPLLTDFELYRDEQEDRPLTRLPCAVAPTPSAHMESGLGVVFPRSVETHVPFDTRVAAE